jgi:hypothetical protein
MFRCGYCLGWVRVAAGRLATVHGQVRLVHVWHPVRAGESRSPR